jgi:hypothetical protein
MSDNEFDLYQTPMVRRQYVVDESDGTYKLVPHGEESETLSSDEKGMRQSAQPAGEMLVSLLDLLEPVKKKHVMVDGRQVDISVRGSAGYKRVTHVDFHTEQPQWIW